MQRIGNIPSTCINRLTAHLLCISVCSLQVATTPTWQADAVKAYLASGATTPGTGNFNANGRGYPDVAVVGHNYIISLGGPTQVDGTSCSSPVFAGMVSNLNAIRIAAGKPVLGFLNPLIVSSCRTGRLDAWLYITQPAASASTAFKAFPVVLRLPSFAVQVGCRRCLQGHRHGQQRLHWCVTLGEHIILIPHSTCLTARLRCLYKLFTPRLSRPVPRALPYLRLQRTPPPAPAAPASRLRPAGTPPPAGVCPTTSSWPSWSPPCHKQAKVRLFGGLAQPMRRFK